MDQREFLIKATLRAFNEQYHRDYKYEDFDIVSIHHTYYKYAYEVYTIRDDDNVRLRLYFSLGPVTRIGRFKLHEATQTHLGNGDEIYASYGVIGDDFFAYSHSIGKITRDVNFLPADFEQMAVVKLESGFPLLLEDGSYLHLEIATAGGLYPKSYKR